MKRNAPVFVLLGSLLVSTITWSHAETASDQANAQTTKSDSKPNSAIWDKVEKVRADAQEEKALAEKAWAEANLKEAVLKKQATEKIFQTQLEIEMAKESQRMSELIAKRAEANAALAEAQVKEARAKAELRAIEQSASAFCDARVAAAKVEKLERELKLAKVQMEMAQLKPQN